MLNFCNNKKVSVIVPVYNTSKYLRQCLDSLICQTLKEIEIICVNDGSTDDSLKILKEYADKDERIIVIDQTNQGQSCARNNGMRIAMGEYIGFLDSDDWADLRMFEKLYANAKIFESEVVMCSVFSHDETSNVTTTDSSYFSLDSLFDSSFENRSFNWVDCADFLFRICVVPWNKIYKRTFLRDNNIKFVEGLNFEDEVFFTDMFTLANKVSLLREHLVYYRMMSETSYSFSNACDEKKLDFFRVYKKKKEILQKRGLYRVLKKDFRKNSLKDLQFWYDKMTDPDVKKTYKKLLQRLYPKLIIEKQVQFILNIYSKIRISQLCSKKKVVFWGASLFLEDFFKNYVKNPHNIIGIIDRSKEKQGQYLGCVKIFAPEDLETLNPDVIIPSVKNIENFDKILKKELEGKGLDIEVLNVFNYA